MLEQKEKTMPKRHDIQKILIIGAGPIIIGQGCEFDYSGVQACKALTSEGYDIVLVNSNPATIMTDPGVASRTYIEPLHWEALEKVIAIERPDAILPTMGGQTALNCARELSCRGILEKYQIELIGASIETIDKAENRQKFSELMISIGLSLSKSFIVKSMEEALQRQVEIGFPTVIRPSYTLGGAGGGIAYNKEEFEAICARGFSASVTQELLIEESLVGWKEFEMEVVRDKADNCIIVCGIENVDPMGIHTGDSITVAPIQTLTDKEYQVMRNASIDILRAIGVETGGANVQFAVEPKTGRMVVIEMNPRVSRSSALASKATGFPIAKVAAKLAVGYTLDELSNDMTGGLTPSSFEPTIDYVVTKIPRFDFEKFPLASPYLTTQMKSVGEVMAIGQNFQASLQKALAGLEIGSYGLMSMVDNDDVHAIKIALKTACPKRIFYVADAMRQGISIEEIYELTGIDPWFLREIESLVSMEKSLEQECMTDLTPTQLTQLKKVGFTDKRLAELLNVSEETFREYRHQLKVRPAYRRVDSCAAEFPVKTAYLYSVYGGVCESKPSHHKKMMVLGGGPNRVAQGIEFDYCCVQAIYAAKELGHETIMVNCNPETVSTDYDTSDKLYFEPITLESIIEINQVETPSGVIVQYGGQTPLKLACSLHENQVPLVGTSSDAIDLAEDRARFQALIKKLGLKQPRNVTVTTTQEGLEKAQEVGFPLVVRPSYVLGGRAMEIVYNSEELEYYLSKAVVPTEKSPILLDHFLDGAIEVDIDGICDTADVHIAGIMEHIEEAGVHSGDSSCSLPPYSLSQAIQEKLCQQATNLALALGVKGLFNVQFAIQNDDIYILEVNPRASRTVPFVSKAVGYPFAKIAARCMMGETLKSFDLPKKQPLSYFAIKHPVFPFIKFPGVDPILGPEMRATGEAMGIANTFGAAYAKGFLGISPVMPKTGRAFVSVKDRDKPNVIELADKLVRLGFEVVATKGTAKALQTAGISCKVVNKVLEGRPNIVDMIKEGDIQLVVNTTEGRQSIADSHTIRCSAIQHQINCSTTLAGAKAMINGLNYQSCEQVYCLQDLHSKVGECA